MLDKKSSIEGLRLLTKLKSEIVHNISREDIRLVYKFEKLIGKGAFGVVRLAYKTDHPDKKFAIKTMNREMVE